MAGSQKRGGGDLTERVVFEKRIETENIDGNTLGEWQPMFETAAGYLHLRGGESVIASRLQSQHPQVIYVRRSSSGVRVTPEWRIRDLRTNVTYNIRDITPSLDRAWLDFLCMAGVADG